MNLVLISKNNRITPKISKINIASKNGHMRLSEAKG